MGFVAALLFILQVAPPFQQTQETPDAKATVQGVVVRAGTNEPVARARVTAFRTADANGAQIQRVVAQNILAAMTDNQGHFVIKDLDPGSYTVTAQRNGFARQVYGERAPGRPGAPLRVVAGQRLQDIVFRLVPAATISGRVFDATGEPLVGINIQALRSVYDQNGKRTFQPAGAARTNDRGEYRIYWITPGRYYVNASPPPNFQIFPTTNEFIEPGYVTTYYPGATDSSTAVAVEVQAGSELNTIDFTLTRQPLFKVRGRVFDTRTGQFPQNANISLAPRTPGGGFVFTTVTSPVNYNPADGTFELRDVAAGAYWVRAIVVNPGPGLTPADMARNTVQVAVNVSNGDLDNVVLALSSGFSIRGRISLDGTPISAVGDLERARVTISPLEQIPFGPNPQPIKPDGTFTFENIQAGDYRLNVFAMPPNMFIESIRLGQTDVSSGVTIAGPVSDSLDIFLSTKGGQVDGTVVDKNQNPMKGIQAVLIPDLQRDRRDLYRAATSNQNGQFTIRTIAPGDYKLFAWEDLEPFAYNDLDFVRKYEALATPVKISEHGGVTVEVKVIPEN